MPAASKIDLVFASISISNSIPCRLIQNDLRIRSQLDMPLLGVSALSADEIDDLLYFTRVNEVEDLKQTITELSQKYNCCERDVLASAVDPESGNTVLHYCSANGFSDLLKTLLASLGIQHTTGSSSSSNEMDSTPVNATNKEGNTALHWAAYNGHLEVAKILVSSGADMWIKNAAGHLAMFEAERAEKSDVVQYLLEVGGDRVDRTAQSPTQANVEDAANGEASSSNGAADVSMMDTHPSG